MTQAAEPVKTPTHLWIVGVLSLLWNAVGAFDYLMTMRKDPGYMSVFTPEQQAYFYGFPVWANAGWALGVGASVIGSALLLARRRHAVTAFLLSIAGLAVSTLYQFGFRYGELERLFGTVPMIFTAIIWIVIVALLFYARRQDAAGVLR